MKKEFLLFLLAGGFAFVSCKKDSEPPGACIMTAGDSAMVSDTITFDATCSTDASTFSWTFGDSHTGSGSVVKHAYSSAGHYTVVLTVGNDDGKTESVSTAMVIQ